MLLYVLVWNLTAGYVHSEQAGKPSLVLDLMELYRSNADDFMLQFTKKLTKKDFEFKGDNKIGKREFLKKDLADQMMVELNQFFERKVAVCRINLGTGSQQLESLIVEEAQRLAKYLRNEKPSWVPRIAQL